LRKLILLLSFSQYTPLLWSAEYGRLEVCRLLVESKADVAVRDNKCFSPPPSHHLLLTVCLAAFAKLHSQWPSVGAKSTLLHTCAASARRNDVYPRPAMLLRNKKQFRAERSASARGMSLEEGRNEKKIIENVAPATVTFPASDSYIRQIYIANARCVAGAV
jgi:hypothetical protein